MLLAVMFSVAMMADDIIVTKDSQRINGKIEEVGLDAIKYRRSDNLTGPLYTLQKKDIATIIYENGHIETFQEEVQQPAVALSSNNQTHTPKTYLAPITYSGGVYYQGDKAMTWKEYMNFIQKHCPAAYNQYKTGRAMDVTGTVMYILGLAMAVPGGLLYGLSEESEYINGYGTIKYINKAKWDAGVALLTVGCTSFAVGLPIMCVGMVKQSKTLETYNSQCAEDPDITFNITAGANGLGLAINF